MNARTKAVLYFEIGFADKQVGRLLGIPHDAVKKWLYVYRAHGKETLFMTKHKTCSHELKVEAARAKVADSLRHDYSLGLVLNELFYKSTYYRRTGDRRSKVDKWADVRPFVRKVISHSPNGMGYRQVATDLKAD